MRRFLLSFLSLRWKLTLSYMLVAVGALVVVQVFIFAGLAALISSGLLSQIMAQMLRDAAPQAAPYMQQDPPDVEGLQRKLDLTLIAPASHDREEFPGADFGTSVLPYVGAVFVLDSERRVIGGVPPIAESSVGRDFGAESLPGLEPLLAEALDGTEDPARLNGSTPNGDLLATAPIKAGDGEVLGALVATFRLPSVAGPLFTGLAISAIALTVAAGLVSTIFGFFTAWRLTRRLGRLTDASRAWSQGDFSYTAKDRSHDEIGRLARDLNRMAADLENLIQTRGELATLEARNRFARDLHDSVKQQVFATSLQVAAARALIRRDTQAAEAHLEQAAELVRQAQRELNVLIHEMRPAALDGKGLATALRDYTQDWSRGSEIPVEFHVKGERKVPLEVEQALFRVAQESLANVAKHSGATSAEVELSYNGDTVTLEVSDNGGGFDPQQKPGSGFGLQSMRERMERLGGRLEIESKPGAGTRVLCTCPTRATKEES
jgi:NarL family two-component system sensor histidine kinase LiaS